MAIVHIRVNGREYDLACDDGQEEHLRLLADEVDERVRALTFGAGTSVTEPMGLLLAALTMADEITENKKEIERLATAPKAASNGAATQARLAEIESAMAGTLNDIAARIEKIADSVEIQ